MKLCRLGVKLNMTISKISIPEGLITYIRERTISYGKVKLVLKHNKYFIESTHPESLQWLLNDQLIQEARVHLQPDRTTKPNLFTSGDKASSQAPNSSSISGPQERGIKEASSKLNNAASFTSIIGMDTGMRQYLFPKTCT
jgi:DNA excision repair protein ERCC-3